MSSNELFTCSDDKQLLRWTQEGELGGKMAETEGFITSISWFPDVGKRSANMFACACTDGTWRIWTLSGQNAREEKKISAHTGAVISVKWNWDGSGNPPRRRLTRTRRIRRHPPPTPRDGLAAAPVLASAARHVAPRVPPGHQPVTTATTPPITTATATTTTTAITLPALISAGEDGELKVWSRSGNLRSSLCSAGTAVYCFVWGPDNDTVLYTAGKTLNMKSHQGTGKCGCCGVEGGLAGRGCGCCGVLVAGEEGGGGCRGRGGGGAGELGSWGERLGWPVGGGTYQGVSAHDSLPRPHHLATSPPLRLQGVKRSLGMLMTVLSCAATGTASMI